MYVGVFSIFIFGYLIWQHMADMRAHWEHQLKEKDDEIALLEEKIEELEDEISEFESAS